MTRTPNRLSVQNSTTIEKKRESKDTTRTRERETRYDTVTSLELVRNQFCDDPDVSNDFSRMNQDHHNRRVVYQSNE